MPVGEVQQMPPVREETCKCMFILIINIIDLHTKIIIHFVLEMTIGLGTGNRDLCPQRIKQLESQHERKLAINNSYSFTGSEQV